MNRSHLESVFSFDTSRINDTTSDWLRNATSDDIALALNIGCAKVACLKSANLSNLSLQPVSSVKSPAVQSGQIGEAFVESILKKHFPVVTNVASQSKSGDLSLFIDHQKIVVEVKNYTNPVPSSGVEKFQRDLTTTNAAGGLFISLKTPIIGVTTSYILRFEYSGTKTIPCAYIVSSDESAIIVAVNMVSQMIGAMCELSQELSRRDKITSSVHILADKLDDLSRARNSLQVSVGEITTRLVKNSCEVSIAEGNIRTVIDDLKTELSDVIINDMQYVSNGLEKNNNFRKQCQKTKDRVVEIMSRLHNTNPSNFSTIWKLNGNKCSYLDTWFQFYANHIDISMPATKVTHDVLLKLVEVPNRKISWQSGEIIITIDDNTYEYILAIIG